MDRNRITLARSNICTCRNISDLWIDHFRSYTAGKMYSPPYYIKAKQWYEIARKEAITRIKEWKEYDIIVNSALKPEKV